MRKCKHEYVHLTWLGDVVIARHCGSMFCGDRLSMGPSNDVGCEVEIEAAALIQDWTMGADQSFTDDSYHGWHAFIDGVKYWVADDDRYAAGFLARAAVCDDDILELIGDSGHDWDPARPVAEQGPGPGTYETLKAQVQALAAAGVIPVTPTDEQRADFGAGNALLSQHESAAASPYRGIDLDGEADARATAGPAPAIADVIDEPEAFDLEVADRAFITAIATDYEDPEAIEEIPDADAMEAIGSIFDRIAGVARATASEAAARLTVPALANEGPPSGFVAWPADEPRQYNGSGEPCDMWIGPCLCGATHTADQRLSESLRDLEPIGGGS